MGKVFKFENNKYDYQDIIKIDIKARKVEDKKNELKMEVDVNNDLIKDEERDKLNELLEMFGKSLTCLIKL